MQQSGLFPQCSAWQTKTRWTKTHCTSKIPITQENKRIDDFSDFYYEKVTVVYSE